jgi:UDP-glucose 4-epimerase
MNKNPIRIIPFLDIKNGLLIKGINLEGLRVLGKASNFSDHYYKNGADEICYIDNVATLYGTNNLSKFISETANNIFIPLSVGSGKTISVNSIAKLLGGDKKRIPKRPGEPDITFADISKIKRKTGWKPRISIKDGIKVMLDNLNDWKDAPVWTPKKINKETKKWFFYLGKKNNLKS